MQMYVLDEAVHNGHIFDVAPLLVHLNLMKEATAAGNNHQYYESSLQFNRCLIGTSSNTVMLRMFDSVKDKILMFIMHERMYSRSNRPYTGIQLFEALYEALADNKGAEAIRILRQVEWNTDNGLVRF